jgi:hypothetical protein
MISQQIIDNLLSAFHLRKTREVEVLVAVEEMEPRHMEVVPPALLRISTLKMNRHSPLSIIKQRLPVGVAVLPEEEEAREVRLHTVREVVVGEDAAVRLFPEVIKIAVVDGGAGGIGTRFFFFLRVSACYLLIMCRTTARGSLRWSFLLNGLC